MKKLWALLLTVAMTVSMFAGCGGDASADGATGTEMQAQKVQQGLTQAKL